MALALVSLLVKLFTYEYLLRDDPTAGIALRGAPGLDSGPKVLMAGDRVLVADENGFIGEGLYRVFSQFGWLIVVAASLFSMWRLRRGKATRVGDG